ncbi:tyrosine-type recombinase/integrase [Actinoplanes sp. ATCC 53533]|uniref:tyrosine-type recombinase/integrase n=1 Tax=Actinoplanes sp. ATCC 53533 TaxID=1288362 RepID=UPI00267D638D
MRLHDLRHGAASLAHAAGADLKTLQDLLGHSSILVTADTYTSVLPATQRHCADATAKLVLDAARRTRKKIKNAARRNRPRPDSVSAAPGRFPRSEQMAGHGPADDVLLARRARPRAAPTWHPSSTQAGESKTPDPRFRRSGIL